MVIAVDSRALVFPKGKKSGARRWNRNLLKALSLHDEKNTYLLLCCEGEGVLLDDLLKKDNFIPVEMKSMLGFSEEQQIFEQLRLPKELKKLKIDIYIGLYFLIPFKREFHAVTIFDDLIPWLIMEGYSDLIPATHIVSEPMRRFQRWKRECLNSSDGFIAVSENTGNDLVKYWNGDQGRCRVVQECIEERFRYRKAEEIPESFRKEHRLPEQYILFVSTVEPRKNTAGLLEAYALYRNRAENVLPLVMVGPKGINYQKNHIEKLKTLGLSSNDVLHYSDYIRSEELPYFYNCASFFCFPSFYEGFGLTLLEALSSGLPAITSDSSSLPEVAGEAALYVNPHDPEDIADKMCLMSDRTELREELVAKGLKQAEKFSYKKTAEAFMKSLEDFSEMFRIKLTEKPDLNVISYSNKKNLLKGVKHLGIVATAREDQIRDCIEYIKSRTASDLKITVLVQKERKLKGNYQAEIVEVLPAGHFSILQAGKKCMRKINELNIDRNIIIYNDDRRCGYFQIELFFNLLAKGKVIGMFDNNRMINISCSGIMRTLRDRLMYPFYKMYWSLKLK